MTCLRPPLDLTDADRIISACVGTTAWRDHFVMGLVAALFLVAFLAGLYVTLRWLDG